MNNSFIHNRAARQYAIAVFNKANDNNAIAITNDFLCAMADVFSAMPNAGYELTMRYNVGGTINIANIFTEGGCKNFGFAEDFLALLAKRNRFYLLPDIAKSYQSLCDRHNNLKHIAVVSATSLNDTDKNAITNELSKLFGTCRVDFSINTTLLAGFQIVIGSSLYDLSLSAKLQKMQSSLTGVVGRYYKGATS